MLCTSSKQDQIATSVVRQCVHRAERSVRQTEREGERERSDERREGQKERGRARTSDERRVRERERERERGRSSHYICARPCPSHFSTLQYGARVCVGGAQHLTDEHFTLSVCVCPEPACVPLCTPDKTLASVHTHTQSVTKGLRLLINI